MPPRYAYWTILVDDQPTAFRSGSQEDLMPTFKRLQSKNPSAKMMWFQNGKLWDSRIHAQEHMRMRGERSREALSERSESKGGDDRQAGFRSRDREFRPKPQASSPKPARTDGKRSAWTPRGEPSTPPPARDKDNKLDWKPKGEFVPAPKRADRPAHSEWKPRAQASGLKPQARSAKPEWKPKGSFDRKAEWKPRTQARGARPEWSPKPQASSPKPTEKRKWVPKEEYKRSQGIEAKRDSKWRPGGEHKDPKQKYKDAKKAKWTRFKQTIRKKWEGKPGKKRDK